MPPTVALFLTLGLIVWLFRRDFRAEPNVSTALWLPLIWIFIVSSKTVSQWLNVLGIPGFAASSAEEGNPLDAYVLFGLIVWGVYVLNNRQASLSQIVRDNQWLTVFVLYCFVAIAWSDAPIPSLRRWIKLLGHPVMVLVLLTEADPEKALTTLMKRCAYVVFPVSILWLKYYPNLARKSTDWGAMMNVGVTVGKNELGSICLIFGLFFFWHVLQILRMDKGRTRRNELLLTTGLLLMIGYCLQKAHSATSVLSLLAGAGTMVFLGLRFVNKRLIGGYVAAGILFLLVAQLTFDIYGSVVDVSGHGSTIEGRGRLWEVLLKTNNDPIFGAGFEGYWVGERIERIWAQPEFQWRPNQAHNGYLEVYLNLGLVGLLILIGLIFVTFRTCIQDLFRNFEWGRLRISYLIAILAHNWTEAGFKGLNCIFFCFYLVALNVPKLRSYPATTFSKIPNQERMTKLASA